MTINFRPLTSIVIFNAYLIIQQKINEVLKTQPKLKYKVSTKFKV